MSHKLVSLYIGDGEYYTRTDADAVIAELKADYKEACDRLQTANLIKDEQIAATRHSKRKRCLAMTERCLTEKVYWHYRYNDYGDKGYTREYKWRKVKLWRKWAMRWLKIAEIFKDKETK